MESALGETSANNHTQEEHKAALVQIFTPGFGLRNLRLGCEVRVRSVGLELVLGLGLGIGLTLWRANLD